MKFGRIAPFLTVLLLIGCGKPDNVASIAAKETYIPDANSVGFDILPAPENSTSAWIGTYSSQGKTARFRFEFDQPKEMDSGIKNFPMAFGKGRLIAMDGSDASVLLLDLSKALEAKKLPGKVARLSQLPFEYVQIGQNQSQALSDGGFNNRPRGNWTVVKIFLGENNQECEFFINFNSVIRKGQFSMKDEEYGNEVIAQLAKVL